MLLRGLFLGLRDAEHLSQIREIGLVLAHVLAWRIRQLRHRLTVAANHLDDDLQRVVAKVVGQIGADAEGQFAASAEAFVQLQHLRNVERVGEHEDLGARVAAVRLVVFEQAFAPVEWIARDAGTKEGFDKQVRELSGMPPSLPSEVERLAPSIWAREAEVRAQRKAVAAKH